jgi:hypothetical protein
MYHNVKPLSCFEQVTSWRYEDGERYIEFRFEKLTLLTLLFHVQLVYMMLPMKKKMQAE